MCAVISAEARIEAAQMLCYKINEHSCKMEDIKNEIRIIARKQLNYKEINMSITSTKQTCSNILTATFKSILEVLDAAELEDCIDNARSKALEDNFKSKDIPLIFTDSSKRLRVPKHTKLTDMYKPAE